MSDKAVGYDWKRSSIPTLRHSAGCEQFTLYKEKKKKTIQQSFRNPDELMD